MTLQIGNRFGAPPVWVYPPLAVFGILIVVFSMGIYKELSRPPPVPPPSLDPPIVVSRSAPPAPPVAPAPTAPPTPAPVATSTLRATPTAKPKKTTTAAFPMLTQSDLVSAMKAIQPKVKECFTRYEAQGTAAANISVLSGGRVGSATVTGKFAGTPTGACVEAAVKSARFPPCAPFHFPWPFQLR
jgi:hypothetical protein